MIRIGQKLREERLRRGLSLEDASQATKIRVAFLTAIEKGDYNKLPSSSYAVGFVRNYAQFLGLPKKETMALFRREFDIEKAYKVLPTSFVKNKPLNKSFKISTAILPVLVALLLLGSFLFYQYRAAFFNPSLVIYTPQSGRVTSSETPVAGRTDPNVILTINDIPVTVEDDGTFSKVLAASPGKSDITIRALNKFGKESVVTRSIELVPRP